MEEKKQENRDEKRIYIICDSLLTAEERCLAEEAAEQLRTLFPALDTVGPTDEPAYRQARSQADRMVAEARREDGKADGSLLLKRLETVRRSLPQAAALVLITGSDLYASSLQLSWCFGVANYQRGVCVHSVYRYRKLTREEQLRCLQRTLRHELGHIFGMAKDKSRANTEEHFGPHCTSPGCSMRQAGTLRALLQCAAEEERSGEYFCQYCREDMQKYFSETGLK